MRLTNGTDIIEIDRIRKIIQKKGKKFLKRVFSDSEIEYCESKKTQKYQSYAVRFAAKEATYKALSENINFSFYWKDFEVCNKRNGKPYMKLNFNVNGMENLEISLSHCKQYAVANALAIFNTDDIKQNF